MASELVARKSTSLGWPSSARRTAWSRPSVNSAISASVTVSGGQMRRKFFTQITITPPSAALRRMRSAMAGSGARVLRSLTMSSIW